MGHLHLAVNQDKRILQIIDTILFLDVEKNVLIIIDYNMKVLNYFGSDRRAQKSTINETFLRMAVHYSIGRTSQHLQDQLLQQKESSPHLSTLFIDNTVHNSRTKHLRAAAKILEVNMVNAKCFLLQCENVCIVSDNAWDYGNEVIPFKVPFIALSHGVPQRGFLHLDTSPVNILVDAYFAIGIRHVKRNLK